MSRLSSAILARLTAPLFGPRKVTWTPPPEPPPVKGLRYVKITKDVLRCLPAWLHRYETVADLRDGSASLTVRKRTTLGSYRLFLGDWLIERDGRLIMLSGEQFTAAQAVIAHHDAGATGL